jgi:hypothetical protein
MVPGLPADLVRFLENHIPTFVAAEVLVFLVRHPESSWTAESIVREIHPEVVTLSAANEYLTLFESHGLVQRDHDGFRYQGAPPDLQAGAEALLQAYNERPVTLIRMIYAIADSRIQSFADAFKLKKD